LPAKGDLLRAFILATVALFELGPQTAAQPAQPILIGDTRAWQEILEAHDRFGRLKSYRITFQKMAASVSTATIDFPRGFVTVGGRVLLLGGDRRASLEAVNPDRARYIVEFGGYDPNTRALVSEVTYERIEVGNGAAERVLPGARDWTCTSPRPRPSIPLFLTLRTQLPRIASIDLTVLGRSGAVDGYEYIITMRDSTPSPFLFRERLFLLLDSRLPERIQNFTGLNEVSDVTVRDVDAPFQISLPACTAPRN